MAEERVGEREREREDTPPPVAARQPLFSSAGLVLVVVVLVVEGLLVHFLSGYLQQKPQEEVAADVHVLESISLDKIEIVFPAPTPQGDNESMMVEVHLYLADATSAGVKASLE